MKNVFDIVMKIIFLLDIPNTCLWLIYFCRNSRSLSSSQTISWFSLISCSSRNFCLYCSSFWSSVQSTKKYSRPVNHEVVAIWIKVLFIGHKTMMNSNYKVPCVEFRRTSNECSHSRYLRSSSSSHTSFKISSFENVQKRKE